MEPRIQHVIESCADASKAGEISFGEVIAALDEHGVESYHADYRLGSLHYYLPSGETHNVTLSVPAQRIGEAFDAEALKEAIRGAQRGELKYPEFIARSMAAGCIGYFVWISGRHVTYFGRRGEQHVEPFPTARV
jgi:uncharacterized protein YbcV (DUF1398 family)